MNRATQIFAIRQTYRTSATDIPKTTVDPNSTCSNLLVGLLYYTDIP